MATLIVKERVQHIMEDGEVRFTAGPAVTFRDEPDGDHPAMVRRATELLAAHYARFIQLGGNSERRPSGLCRDHRVVRIYVVQLESDVILASKDLEAA